MYKIELAVNNLQWKQKWEDNRMDITSDKLAKSHTRRLGHSYERENLREKVNLF